MCKPWIVGLRCLALAGFLLVAVVAAPEIDDEPKEETEGAVSGEPEVRELVRVQTIEAPVEIATEFGPAMGCDLDGNLYMHADEAGTVRKLSPKGERLATFNPGADPSVKTDASHTFALAPDGDLYALIFAHEITRYVFVYRADGRYKSTIKLDPGFAWSPSALAVFSSGELLITGHRYKRGPNREITQVPFTGLFRSDGTLLKEIAPEEDASLQKLREAGDERLVSPQVPGINRAISFSQTAAGEDGNLYLMRWFNPAIIYAISPGGEVVRRFAVDPEDATLRPMAMRVSGSRMAVQFYEPQTGKRLMKIADLEGNPVATYGHTTSSVGLVFACYTAVPERFTFLGATEESKLQLIVAEGR